MNDRETAKRKQQGTSSADIFLNVSYMKIQVVNEVKPTGFISQDISKLYIQ